MILRSPFPRLAFWNESSHQVSFIGQEMLALLEELISLPFSGEFVVVQAFVLLLCLCFCCFCIWIICLHKIPFVLEYSVCCLDILFLWLNIRVMVFDTTFNNISVTLWRSVLLVEEIGVPGENHWPTVSHWETLSHNVVSSTSRHQQDLNSQH